MISARATAGGMLRRLASGLEAGRCAAVAASATRAPSVQQAGGISLASSLLSSSSSSPSSSSSALFHTSARRAARRRRRFNSVPAAQMGLVDEESIAAFSKEHFPGYTTAEKKKLAEKYTPAQMAALEAGEAAIDPRDLTVQGRLRTDAEVAGINYLSDFSKIETVIDKRPRDPKLAANVAVDIQPMSDEVFADDFVDWLESYVPKDVNVASPDLTDAQLDSLAEKHGPSDVEVLKYWHERPAFVHADGKTRVRFDELGNSSLAPALPKPVPGGAAAADGSGADDDESGAAMRRRARAEADIDPRDPVVDEAGTYDSLVQRTGLKKIEINSLIIKELLVRVVSNQTRLGKVQSFSVMMVAGNGNGRLGLGVGKATEYTNARQMAVEFAIRNMQPIRRYENRTIYGNMEVKISGTIVRLSARPPGFGLRVPYRIFEMARAAGITDLAAKIPRSRNPMNTVKATYEALIKQPDPEEIAIGRGKKLVDIRQVYYGGAVY